mmetsp:Transcript_15674/g.39965  ORF Transcript_15674/g.39965 Transcript_15674/m.39965 type:complete len:310 (+) Transcript_15674:155-1084(+)
MDAEPEDQGSSSLVVHHWMDRDVGGAELVTSRHVVPQPASSLRAEHTLYGGSLSASTVCLIVCVVQFDSSFCFRLWRMAASSLDSSSALGFGLLDCGGLVPTMECLADFFFCSSSFQEGVAESSLEVLSLAATDATAWPSLRISSFGLSSGGGGLVPAMECLADFFFCSSSFHGGVVTRTSSLPPASFSCELFASTVELLTPPEFLTLLRLSFRAAIGDTSAFDSSFFGVAFGESSFFWLFTLLSPPRIAASGDTSTSLSVRVCARSGPRWLPLVSPGLFLSAEPRAVLLARALFNSPSTAAFTTGTAD